MFSPGKDSGTFDYFTEVVLAGDAPRLATPVTTCKHDDVLVQGLSTIPLQSATLAMHTKSDQLRVVPIRRSATNPAVPPSVATVPDHNYPGVLNSVVIIR